ncbi:MAG: hypothetical protein HC817_03945 [Saprospiraceae bacterium]|nr:hypothetical protein [Saprospiraceae bacterium]
MTLDEIRELLSENAKQLVALKERQEQLAEEVRAEQALTSKQIRQTNEQLAAWKDRQEQIIEEVRKEQALTDRQIRQTNKQLGELSNKWGTFTEGMAGESIRKILNRKFEITNTSFRTSASRNGESIELDGFGYANGDKNVAVIVEVKSHLRDDAIEQIENTLANFPKFFPEHADKKLYSLVVCVHAPTTLENVCAKRYLFSRHARRYFYDEIP